MFEKDDTSVLNLTVLLFKFYLVLFLQLWFITIGRDTYGLLFPFPKYLFMII